jgi:hypothetical protein
VAPTHGEVPGYRATMTDDGSERTGESLEQFKNSFSYGSRSDLNFKFLKSLSPDDAGVFFQQLLREIGDSLDHGNISRLHQLVVEAQVGGYEGRESFHKYEDAPFSIPTRPVAQSRVGVLTSSGHFAAEDDPTPFGVENMTQEEAESRIGDFLRATPELSAIPTDIDPDDLRVRHGGYDVRSVSHDPNVALPLQIMQEMETEGRIGELSSPMYSFTGATSQGRLRKQALPHWIDRLRTDGVEVLLLVPV